MWWHIDFKCTIKYNGVLTDIIEVPDGDLVGESNPEKYAELFKQINADYFELKAYVWVGYSKSRMKIENMPRHDEIVEFANKVIASYPELKIIDEKKESRVVLLAKQDNPNRIMKFDSWDYFLNYFY